MNVKMFRLAIMSIAIIVLSVMTSCGGGQQQQQAPAPEIATITVGTSDAELNRAYPATIKGKADIDIRPQVTGFITKVHVDEGQKVKKGQLLFTLDQVQFNAAVDQALAAVKVAETAVATAQLTANNKKSLFEKNIISEYEYKLAENALAQAEAQMAQANASLVNARKNLTYTVVTSPSNGVVGSIPNRVGALASPSMAQPLTTVSDNDQVYAYFSLTEKDILGMTNNGSISLDQAIATMPNVNLRLADGNMYGLTGKIATISGVIDQGTGSASVRALFSNPSGMLRSGSTGTILIPYVENNVIIIPQKATFEIQDKKYVYTVNDSSKTVTTPIEVFNINDGQEYIVTSGLKAGDKIVVEGVGTTVKDGMAIKPIDKSQAAPNNAPSTK
ncbi:MAG: efflux RND transporter periplasmic adaptor subunit [Bacteroidales bacterium]|nr:efflux RND transporter periplasmic adaptor subunit [Bacteroidales bacterium]